MKKPLLIIHFIFLSATLISCRKEIKSEKGGIDLISNVYFNASKSLDNRQSFHISKLNYEGDSMVELVPDLEVPEMTNAVYFIKDSTYYDLREPMGGTLISEIKKKQKPKSVFQKRAGAIFSKDKIPNYKNRRKLSDTVLFNKNYRRFEVNSPWNHTRFYVYKTDTILPYSLYKEAENDFGGRIERIDSYNKKKDVFVSLQLLPRKNWDSEAKEIFDFNQFAKNRK